LVVMDLVLCGIIILRTFEPIVQVLQGPGQLWVVPTEVVECQWTVP